MIQQGLQINIVPVPGTHNTHSVSVYSQGFEDGQKVVERHVLVAPLHGDSPEVSPGEFSGWTQHMVDVAANLVCAMLETLDTGSLSAAYAHAEDEEEKASHRM